MGCAFSSINAAFWALQMKKLGQALLRYLITSQISQSPVVSNKQVLFIIANSEMGF